MCEKSERKKENNNISAEELVRELGVLNMYSDFKTDIQYINIIGSIEGHTVFRPKTKPQNTSI